MNWLHWLGLDDPSGPVYLFYSGVGSDLAEVAILGGIFQLWRRHNCHVRGCWRVGVRQVPGTPHIVCHRHHPKPLPTAQQVLADHHAARVF